MHWGKKEKKKEKNEKNMPGVSIIFMPENVCSSSIDGWNKTEER